MPTFKLNIGIDLGYAGIPVEAMELEMDFASKADADAFAEDELKTMIGNAVDSWCEVDEVKPATITSATTRRE